MIRCIARPATVSVRALAGALVLLAGAPPASAAPMMGSSYREAYAQGCASGYADAGRDGFRLGYRKDVERYTADADYRRGWDEGHAACYDEARRNPRVGVGGG